MTDLCDWLNQVYLRYPGARLPTCWLWHPDIIEELLWLRHAHAEAYDQHKGDWRRVGDWHDRYRPRVVDRVKSRCEVSDHCLDKPGGRVPPGLPLVSSAPKLTEFWTRPDSATAPRPAPTDEELTESDVHNNFQTT